MNVLLFRIWYCCSCYTDVAFQAVTSYYLCVYLFLGGGIQALETREFEQNMHSVSFYVMITLIFILTPFFCPQSFIVSYWLLLLFANLICICISQSLDLFCVFFAWLTLPCTYHILILTPGTTRGIQGRFNDISLILASNAARNESDGKLTEGAIAALDDVARIQTLMHQLFWCV